MEEKVRNYKYTVIDADGDVIYEGDSMMEAKNAIYRFYFDDTEKIVIRKEGETIFDGSEDDRSDYEDVLLEECYESMTDDERREIEETEIVFKVGRGGRFYNPGHLSVCDFGGFDKLMERVSDRVFEDEEEEVYRDCDGNEIGEFGGRSLDFDGDYERYYVKTIGECDDDELSAIKDFGVEDMTEVYIDHKYMYGIW